MKIELLDGSLGIGRERIEDLIESFRSGER